MIAWVEWHFANFSQLKKKTGNSFDCSTCPSKTQEERRCNVDAWDNQGTPFPLKLFEGSNGHSFCPAKLFRDDPGFCQWMEMFYASWQLGKSPNGETIASMDVAEVEMLNFLIKTWQYYDKVDKFQILATILGGT